MSMLETAEVVAKRYGVTREAQDSYALESQRRIAAAQREGRLDAEIVPLKSVKLVADKATGETREESVTLAQDEGNRADTTGRGPRRAEARGQRRRDDHGRQREPAVRRRLRLRRDGRQAGRAARPPAARHLPRARRRRVRARRDGDRAGLRGAAAPRAPRAQGGRHRPLGAQRGVRGPGRLLPGPPGHPDGEAERRRRLDRDRPPLRDERRPHDGPRAHRGEAAARQARRRDDVHRRRHGRGGLFEIA